jgi:sigma-E factor negative regulatory protein RseB
MAPGRRIAGVAAILGLLGTAVAGMTLTSEPSSTGPAAAPPISGLGPGGRPLRAARGPAAARASLGLRLLREAAAACQDMPYEGSQLMRWWSGDKTSAAYLQVWHHPGGLTLVRATRAGQGARGATGSAAADGQDASGVLGMSGRLLGLLQANYQVVYAGRGSADRRSALLVEVRRPGGGLAAIFWLDAATRLPLRRKVFDARAHVISDDAFTRLELKDPGRGGQPAAVAPWPAQLDQARLAALRARGWDLPAGLPGNLSLFAASQAATRSGPVVDLSYSDGLAVVSVFVQRGQLGHPAPGWRRITVSGQTIYSVNPQERSFTWSAGGFVYTLVADAPLETVSQVAAALPGPSAPGFWQRIAHGLHRLVSWLNPIP